MQSKPHGLRAIKLTEIPLEQRLAAARRAKSLCRDLGEAADVLAAALAPSDKTYWIREQAAVEA